MGLVHTTFSVYDGKLPINMLNISIGLNGLKGCPFGRYTANKKVRNSAGAYAVPYNAIQYKTYTFYTMGPYG